MNEKNVMQIMCIENNNPTQFSDQVNFMLLNSAKSGTEVTNLEISRSGDDAWCAVIYTLQRKDKNDIDATMKCLSAKV